MNRRNFFTLAIGSVGVALASKIEAFTPPPFVMIERMDWVPFDWNTGEGGHGLIKIRSGRYRIVNGVHTDADGKEWRIIPVVEKQP